MLLVMVGQGQWVESNVALITNPKITMEINISFLVEAAPAVEMRFMQCFHRMFSEEQPTRNATRKCNLNDLVNRANFVLRLPPFRSRQLRKQCLLGGISLNLYLIRAEAVQFKPRGNSVISPILATSILFRSLKFNIFPLGRP